MFNIEVHIIFGFRFVSHIKKLFDEETEILMEETLIRGYVRASDVIGAVIARMKKSHGKDVSLVDVRDKFISLVTAKYLQRYGGPEEERFKLPSLGVQQLQVGEDKGVHWCANFDRFHQDMRDALLVGAVGRRFDENAAELMRCLLQQMYVRTLPWAHLSNPVQYSELKEALRKRAASPHLLAYLDHYLAVLCEDESAFIARAGDAGGGQFVVQLKRAVEQLAWALVENTVLEKFDTRAARIFRLVRAKRYIEPEHIQQLAMIPGKEAKRLSYQLLEQGFLQAQELRKAGGSGGAATGAPTGGGGGPNKCFVLFHADLQQVVRMVRELCLQALYNCMTRRHHDKHVNRRIIDKKHRVDTITMSLRAQGAPQDQLADIEDMITPPEKDMLERIGKVMKRLNMAELELDDSLHLLQLYLCYQLSPS